MSEAREDLEDIIAQYAFDYDIPDYRRGTRWQDVMSAIDKYEESFNEMEDS